MGGIQSVDLATSKWLNEYRSRNRRTQNTAPAPNLPPSVNTITRTITQTPTIKFISQQVPVSSAAPQVETRVQERIKALPILLQQNTQENNGIPSGSGGTQLGNQGLRLRDFPPTQEQKDVSQRQAAIPQTRHAALQSLYARYRNPSDVPPDILNTRNNPFNEQAIRQEALRSLSLMNQR